MDHQQSITDVPVTLKRLLKVPAAAYYLDVSPITIYHWISRGEIPFVKLRKKAVRIDIRDLDKLIQRSKVRSSDEARAEGAVSARQHLVAGLPL